MRTKTWSLLASLAQPLSVLSSCCSCGSRLVSSFGSCSKSWGWGSEVRSVQGTLQSSLSGQVSLVSHPGLRRGAGPTLRHSVTALGMLKNCVSFVKV